MRQSYEVIIERPAQDDMDKAYAWIDAEAPQAAVAWYDGLVDAVKTLRSFPRRCPLAPENDAFDEEIRQLLYGKSRYVYRVLFTVAGRRVHPPHPPWLTATPGTRVMLYYVECYSRKPNRDVDEVRSPACLSVQAKGVKYVGRLIGHKMTDSRKCDESIRRFDKLTRPLGCHTADCCIGFAPNIERRY